MRILPFLLYLILIALHTVITEDLTAILSARINLTAFIILAVALYKGELASLWFGFFAGLVAGAVMPQTMGWYALFGASLGLLAFHMKERLNLDSQTARLLITFIGVFLFNLAIEAITQPDGIGHLWWSAGATGAVYTTLLATIFFGIKHGVLTRDKVKSIF
jgi:rod shape-determining protein MreD